MSKNERILAEGIYRNNDTWETGLNNNDLIIGASGAGKTRNYVKPNLLQCNESVIVADTKGQLCKEVGPVLKKNGYDVQVVDFTDLGSGIGYNPLDFIRYNPKTKRFMEQDIMKIATCLVSDKHEREKFWPFSARLYMEVLIGYVLEFLPKEEHNLKYVLELFSYMDQNEFDVLFREVEYAYPDSFTAKKYQLIKGNRASEKTHSSIKAFVSEALNPFAFAEAETMLTKKKRVRFSDLGRKKTVLFVNISDVDRSMDGIINLFYTQALQTLCEEADKHTKDGRLPVPVRIILDDFAANVEIPDFDKIISVIRSREIYVSVILQSVSQLNSMYGADRAMTIMNNCDNWLYLGGQDVTTSECIAVKANKLVDSILNMPLGEAYLFTRGEQAKMVRKYDIKCHEKYKELQEVMDVL